MRRDYKLDTEMTDVQSDGILMHDYAQAVLESLKNTELDMVTPADYHDEGVLTPEMVRAVDVYVNDVAAYAPKYNVERK